MKKSHRNAIAEGQRKSWARGGTMRLAHEKRLRTARKTKAKRRTGK